MKNKVKLRVKGISIYPINMLVKQGVKIINIKFFDNYIEFFIATSDLLVCQKYLEQNNRQYQICNIVGLSIFLNSLKKRVGVLVGLLIFIIVSIFYSLSILTVNISGNNLVATEIIEKKVAESVKVPLFNSRINQKALEKSIVMIDGISNASVSKVGTTINVEVLEELPLTDIEDIKAEFKPITSKYDSLVTRVITTSGTPLVKVGQAVKKGQELIAPYLLADEQTKVLCRAGGQVYGRIWLQKSQFYEEQEIVFNRTGKEYVYYDIKMFNWINKKQKNPFLYYEEESEIIYIGTLTPIKAVKYTYYETEKNFVYFDFELYSDMLIKQLSNELELEIPKDAEILRSWYEVKRLDKKTQLVIYYEVETIIG